MIKSLSILNFQSHEKTELNFHSGVNVIVGSSDSGKSAIIRAMRWLIWNRPSGNSFRSTWGGETSCKILVDGNVVTRSRDKVDQYQIKGEKGTKTTEFKAIGTSVPEEVNRILNIGDINLQYQLDSPFLLSNSPGEAAQHFNKVARLDKIDQGNSAVNSAIRELEQDIKYRTKGIESDEERLKEFDYLDKMEAEVEVYEELEKRLTTKRNGWDKLKKLKYDLVEIDLDLSSYNNLIILEEQVNQIEEFIETRATLDQKQVKLDILLEHIREDTIDLKNLKWVMSFEESVNNLLQLQSTLKTAVEHRTNLQTHLWKMDAVDSDYEESQSNTKALQAEFDKEMGEVCKLCGQSIRKK